MADFQAYMSLFLICVISIFVMRTIFFKSNRAKSRLPPSPFALPIVGHLHLINPNAHQALHKLSLRYGPVFRVLLGSVPCVVVSTPASAKEILKTNETSCLDRPPNAALDYLTYGSKGFSFGPYGSHWKFMKKIIMSHLLNGPTLDLLYPVRHEEINLFIKSLSRNAKLGNAVDVSAELMKISNNIVTRMLLGERCSDNESDAREVRDFIAEMLESMGKFSLSNYSKFFRALDLQGFGKKLKDVHQRFDKLIERIMKEHEEARKQNKTGHQVKDLLYILLDIAEDESMEIKLSRDNIKAFMHDIFVGGSDTSASTMEWALSELINHPNIMKKAVAEIDQVVGKNRLVQESDIPNLPYLQAVVKEALRLYPAGPLLPRQSTQDCTVAGYHIPANTTIFINLWAIGRDPNYWENPLEFSPERYQGVQLDVRGQNFQLIPFGSGRRMCSGASLAMHVMHTTLGAMIQCFEWKAGKDGNLPSVDMEEGHGITLPKANPLVCVPVPRLDPIPSSM